MNGIIILKKTLQKFLAPASSEFMGQSRRVFAMMLDQLLKLRIIAYDMRVYALDLMHLV